MVFRDRPEVHRIGRCGRLRRLALRPNDSGSPNSKDEKWKGYQRDIFDSGHKTPICRRHIPESRCRKGFAGLCSGQDLHRNEQCREDTNLTIPSDEVLGKVSEGNGL